MNLIYSNGDPATVNIVGSAPAGAAVTLISHQIRRPFILRGVIVNCNLGQERKVEHKLFISPDDSQPSSLPMSGFDILQEFSSHNAIVGDNDRKEIVCTASAKEGGAFLKVFANNTDIFDHDVDVQFYIEVF